MVMTFYFEFELMEKRVKLKCLGTFGKLRLHRSRDRVGSLLHRGHN